MAAVAAACSLPAVGADWGAEQLMQALGAVKSSQARFVERKHVAILNAPLETSGRLVYRAPDRLEKHTLSPQRESLVLEGDLLTFSNPERKQRRTLALQDYPVVWAFVESIRSTLAGDLATLSRFYEVALDGSEREWHLTLKPSDPRVRESVREIRIGGRRETITGIEIIEAGGDRSVMTITRDGP
jgi:outer membrane lipoprotein-sorting protein